jgi:hypothetical protein
MNYLGKTIFLLYLLFRRIRGKKITLLRLADNRFIGFSNDGVRLHSVLSPDMDANWNYPLGTWALADISSAGTNLGGPLLVGNKLFVIVTTSPERSRYKEWSEKTYSALYVMDPTSEEELRAYRQVAFRSLHCFLTLMVWTPATISVPQIFVPMTSSSEKHLRCVALLWEPASVVG